jgi:hypothetical protein
MWVGNLSSVTCPSHTSAAPCLNTHSSLSLLQATLVFYLLDIWSFICLSFCSCSFINLKYSFNYSFSPLLYLTNSDSFPRFSSVFSSGLVLTLISHRHTYIYECTCANTYIHSYTNISLG